MKEGKVIIHNFDNFVNDKEEIYELYVENIKICITNIDGNIKIISVGYVDGTTIQDNKSSS